MNSFLAQILPFLLVFVVFYFLLIRPQQKRQKARASMLNAVEIGASVVTIGGLHGTIVELDDTTVTLKVSENTNMVFERSAISTVK
ncbi:MAG: preprotein translocase subunit YajC [Tumebacillaceae bacterium]